MGSERKSAIEKAGPGGEQPQSSHGDVAFLFAGRIEKDRFLAFARHRAARLNLSMRIEADGPTGIGIGVAGHPVLIDMFEMACSLGPPGSIVDWIERRERPEHQVSA